LNGDPSLASRSRWWVVIASFALLAPSAQAYIDPGTGAFLLQAAISALVGVLFAGRRFILRVITSLRSRFWRTHTPTE
jgi:hypothetical protein